MGSGIGHPDLALYRLVKGGDTGLNLRLSDIFDREIEIPNLFTLLMSFIKRKNITIKVKALPASLIESLLTVQSGVDEQMKREIDKAKSRSGL